MLVRAENICSTYNVLDNNNSGYLAKLNNSQKNPQLEIIDATTIFPSI